MTRHEEEDNREITLVCRYHSGMTEFKDSISERCDKMEKVDERQWEEIGKRASNVTVKWGIVLLITVATAIFGVIWDEIRESKRMTMKLQTTIIESMKELGVHPAEGDK